jgi:hypothetical protein
MTQSLKQHVGADAYERMKAERREALARESVRQKKAWHAQTQALKTECGGTP